MAVRVYGWGEDRGCYPQEVEVAVPDSESVLEVGLGPAYTIVVTPSGAVYTVGEGPSGELGLGPDTLASSSLTRVSSLAAQSVKIVHVAAAASHALALSSDGVLYAWGCGADAQLGTGSLDNVYSPRRISKVAHVSFTAVAAMASQSFALDASGGVYAWGFNGTTMVLVPTFVPCTLKTPIATIDAGHDHLVARAADGALAVWNDAALPPRFDFVDGLGAQAQLAPPTDLFAPAISITLADDILVDDDSLARDDAQDAHVAADEDDEDDAEETLLAVDVAAGHGFTLVLASDGNVYGTGLNTHGQMGEPPQSLAHTDAFVRIDGVYGATSVFASGLTACAMLESGALVTWGYGANGALGQGIALSSHIPTRVDALLGSSVIHVVMGFGRVVALVWDEGGVETTDCVGVSVVGAITQ